MLTRVTAREVAGGWVRIDRMQASRSRVRIHASIGLSYYPFREQSVEAIYDSVRQLLPPEFRRARIELYVRAPTAPSVRTVRSSRGSRRPGRRRPGCAAATLLCGRATDAISISVGTAGAGSVRVCGRPARTSTRRGTCCLSWCRCSKMRGRTCCCRASATCGAPSWWPTTTPVSAGPCAMPRRRAASRGATEAPGSRT